MAKRIRQAGRGRTSAPKPDLTAKSYSDSLQCRLSVLDPTGRLMHAAACREPREGDMKVAQVPCFFMSVLAVPV